MIWFDETLAETRRETAPGAFDLTLMRDDGDYRVEPCESLDCRIDTWWDAPGGPAAVVTDLQGTRVEQPGEDVALFGHGRILLADVTGDGLTELITWRDDGLLVVHTATDTSVADPLLWYVARAPGAPWFLADVDGDGQADLFATDDEGRFFVTSPPPSAGIRADGSPDTRF